LIKEGKPIAFFSVVAGLLTAMSLYLGLPVVDEFSQAGLVPGLLAAALAILSFVSFTCRLILDTVSRGCAESKRLAYRSVAVRFTSVKSIDPLGSER